MLDIKVSEFVADMRIVASVATSLPLHDWDTVPDEAKALLSSMADALYRHTCEGKALPPLATFGR